MKAIEHVLAAARDMIQAHGARGWTVKQCARQAGYSVGAVYLYWPTRTALVGQVVLESLERLGEPSDAVAALRQWATENGGLAVALFELVALERAQELTPAIAARLHALLASLGDEALGDLAGELIRRNLAAHAAADFAMKRQKRHRGRPVPDGERVA